jgi:light-regulated signal transduction histidine kinase (bacteriophytochrome)
MIQKSLPYGIAIGCVALAVYARWILNPLLQHHLAYLITFGGVAMAVLFAGWRPATLAAIIGFIASSYLFLPRELFFIFMNPPMWVGMAGYAMSCGLIIYMGESLRQAKQRAEQQAEELKRSNRDLEQFALIVSHDLKEPLKIISAYADLLVRRYKGKLDSKADEFINHILGSTTRMEELIHNLLAYSRIRPENNRFTEIDSMALVGKVLVNLKVSIEESRVTINYNALPRIIADEVQMIQLFQNLLSNSIKFRSENPMVINIKCKEENEEYVFSIKDNGIGISSEDFSNIFEVFRKLHSEAEYPGTGVGLAICRKVIDNHAGKIWVNAKVGRGTTFYFSIPKNR